MASSTYHPVWSNDDLQQNVSEAQWVDYNLDGLATTTVGSLVPTVFDAYARILYPARSSMSRPIPSKFVARWQDQLESIIEVLARSTTAPDECWFAVWEGNTALDGIRATAPTAAIAGYDYFLLKGPVSRAADTLEGLSPNLWWPSDHTWCVAQHFDFHCAYLGGSAETVADILALTSIASMPVRVDQIVTQGHDEHND
ncbi:MULTISPECIES: hypothetical protein [unclassified Rhodococcus (in: high G+C Gram-positive bacteria)]|uniref:hypothetical protein n=1 Tax=unclassified Rhodococcus (in: high G+C Gram-positive bacteria) TaxID=192944 RepID=UPI000B9A1C43|nr:MULTISPECIES: hypothetical protein [unclassified Rhodococcus (in: high G+C Gram-positive bacteria)]OZE24613.1 hypothetical protein CH256_20020 [Rhodococcus sp. 05-2254-6]OZE42224.1 hypothetical protein CH259_02285 [Rhodococcus sp. 05-2254-4]OZE49846.1 hypothetical protein CH261_05035 [Rhodococcus sp. 05-2254-3]OZE50484.1 hypothetical protein CH283_12340 [Rhodococcus sp. 05-2254-2]